MKTISELEWNKIIKKKKRNKKNVKILIRSRSIGTKADDLSGTFARRCILLPGISRVQERDRIVSEEEEEGKSK